MPKSYLSFASISHDHLPDRVSDEHKKLLMDAAGYPIGESAMEELLSLVVAYWHNRVADTSWETWDDTESHLARFRAAVTHLWQLVYGGVRSDSFSQAEELFMSHLKNETIGLLPARDLKVVTDDGLVDFDDAYQIPENPIRLVFNSAVLQGFAQSMTVACNRAETDVQKKLKSPDTKRPRQPAIEALIFGLREWADVHRFKKTPVDDDEAPSSMSRLVACIVDQAPDEIRQRKHNTPSAAAAHIKRVVAAHNKRVREQKQKIRQG